LRYDLLIVDTRHHHEHQRNNGHSFQSGVHGFLKDVEVTVVLRHSFDISFLVESVLFFLVILNGLLVDDLVRSTHFKEATRGVVVTVKDSLDDGFDLWRLDEIQDLQLYGDL
jgi:hypothetical protein